MLASAYGMTRMSWLMCSNTFRNLIRQAVYI
jgi:hypothetical protein